jgi:(S)-2-hydroxyglutarate dehydrogenase
LRNDFDVVIIGAGVLGASIAFWLSSLSTCSIALVDKENDVAQHTSSRNTGVIHRPFYLNPTKKKVFARASQKSYFLWKVLAKNYDLAWSQVGTLEVAANESQLGTLEQYRNWAIENGMVENEVEVLDRENVKKIEPEVLCPGAIYSKTDTAVNFRELTNCVYELAKKNDVKLVRMEIARLEKKLNGIELSTRGSTNGSQKLNCDFVINASGGGAIDICHSLGLAMQYTDLHFRGEYWIVSDEFGRKIGRNIYSVARHKEFPFLDPHFIVRASGTREVGPNAVLVADPDAYKGISSKKTNIAKKLFERPLSPKTKLFSNAEFLSLVWQEWRSSLSKKRMCERVRHFIPSLNVSYLEKRGLAGVRSSLIDEKGFVPEAVIEQSDRSLHILNYNSPGATGAPAFSAFVAKKLFEEGYIQKNRAILPPNSANWNFEDASDLS